MWRRDGPIYLALGPYSDPDFKPIKALELTSAQNQVKMPRSPENNSAAGAAADGQPGAASALTINGVTLTALETKFMVNMVATLEAKPAINWDKLAEIMGLKGKKSKSSYLC